MRSDIHLYRWYLGEEETVGSLFLPGGFECFTLEDQYQAVKVFGETCIPEGTYKLTLRHSPKFGRDMIMLMDVPDFQYIYFHAGATDFHTNGCILVGDGAVINHNDRSTLLHSRDRLQRIEGNIKKLMADGDTFVHIKKMLPSGPLGDPLSIA